MAYEAQFSWRKILSFFGVAILAFCGIIGLAGGINLIVGGKVAGGIFAILSGICGFVSAVLLYRNYNKYSKENNNQKPNYTR